MSDALGSLASRRVGGFHDGARRGPARPHDDAGALVGDVALLKTCIADRLLHRDMIPGRAYAEETHGAAVDDFGRVERGRAVHLAADAELGVFVGARDA